MKSLFGRFLGVLKLDIIMLGEKQEKFLFCFPQKRKYKRPIMKNKDI
jgi:hypothetical protein